jgi:hypothetical protein
MKLRRSPTKLLMEINLTTKECLCKTLMVKLLEFYVGRSVVKIPCHNFLKHLQLKMTNVRHKFKFTYKNQFQNYVFKYEKKSPIILKILLKVALNTIKKCVRRNVNLINFKTKTIIIFY